MPTFFLAQMIITIYTPKILNKNYPDIGGKNERTGKNRNV